MIVEILNQIATNIVPIVLGIFGTGTIVAIIKYKETRPENLAKAKLLNTTAEAAVGDAWMKYAQTLEERIEKLEFKYEKRSHEDKLLIIKLQKDIDSLGEIIREQTVETNSVRIQKDKEIADLQKKVSGLEAELKTYRVS
jgi:hypothetical protein